MLAFALTPLLLLGLLVHFHASFGDPFAFLKVQAAWGRSESGVLLKHIAETLSGSGSLTRLMRFSWSRTDEGQGFARESMRARDVSMGLTSVEEFGGVPVEGFPSVDDGGVGMNRASAIALAVAVRVRMWGEREWSARQCSAVALRTVATDLQRQSSAVGREARQRIENRRVRFLLGGGKGG